MTIIFEDLKQHLGTHQRRVLTRPRAAAILVPIIDDGGPLRVLLTRRTETLPTHKGQVAFPGGKIEPGDAGPTEAALREAHEEVGLPPERVEILGWLDDLPTIHDDTTVTPVVARVAQLPPLRPDPREVARIFEIPMELLRSPQGWRTEIVHRHSRSWPMFYCDYDGETLWGLSAYVVMNLLQFLPGGPPVEVPRMTIR